MKNLLTILFFLPLLVQAQTHLHQKYPLQGKYFYGNQQYNAADQLVDGDLTQHYSAVGSIIGGQLVMTYTFPDGAAFTCDSIRIFNDTWASFSPKLYVYLKKRADFSEVLVDSFWNDVSNAWKTMAIAVPFQVFQLELKTQKAGTAFGTELEIYGSFNDYTYPTPPVKGRNPINSLLGWNFYSWNILQDPANLAASAMYYPKYNTFTSYLKNAGPARYYQDRQKNEPFYHSYAFEPDHDGWDQDTILQHFKNDSITVLYDIKNNSDSLKALWDASPYADGSPYYQPRVPGSDAEAAASYTDEGKMYWQAAARYGDNTSIDTTLIRLWDGHDKTWMAKNQKRVGTNLVKYYEIGNEWDRNWAPNDYMLGRQFAAFASACYDGDMGRLGAGVGIKVACPHCHVVIAGMATTFPDWLRGVRDWSKEHRNDSLPFDEINYHMYSTDAGGNQWGSFTTGWCPEMGGMGTIAKQFADVSRTWCGNKPVWITEWGNDSSHLSPMKAFPIGSKTTLQVQRDWYVRTMLLLNAQGVNGASLFQWGDNDPTQPSTQFNTMGLFNNDSAVYTPRPAIQGMKQVVSLMNGYTFQDSLSAAPNVYHFVKPGAADIYAIWSPTQSAVTGSYTLQIAASTTVSVDQIQDTGLAVSKSSQTSDGSGNLTVSYSETPVFIEVPNTRHFYSMTCSGTIKLGR